MDAKKSSNPKDAIGATKLPLSLVPATATALASLAHYNGMLKYGAWNWRREGVRASIYLDACLRHVGKWQAGEEVDEEGVPHLASALACLNIIIDARACGKLTDDRPPPVDLAEHFAELTPLVAELKARHAGRAPRHFTIADAGECRREAGQPGTLEEAEGRAARAEASAAEWQARAEAVQRALSLRFGAEIEQAVTDGQS